MLIGYVGCCTDGKGIDGGSVAVGVYHDNGRDVKKVVT